ncbi:MAG: MipA/OmpV family protein [Pseudomonadota bacterium]
MTHLNSLETMKCMLFGAVLATAPALAFAQEEPDSFVALGAASIPDYEGSSDYEAGPFVAARFNFGTTRLELEGTAGRLDVSRVDGFGFGPAFRYRFGRDDDVDNAQVALLPEIDDAFELGFFLRYGQPLGLATADEGVIRLDILYDVADVHSGGVAELSAAYTFRPTARLGLTTSLSTRYVSENFADTYFSVSGVGSAASGLPVFNASDGFDTIGLSVVATYQLSDRWGLIANASVQRLLGDAEDSPLVSVAGDDVQTFFGLGVTYSF